MNIVITGSLGHISKPLAEELIQKKRSVTVISSNAERQKNIKALGAKAAIGSVEDLGFLTKTFAGADVVYLTEPPPNFFDQTLDLFAFHTNLALVYRQAIERSGVSKVVHLSSIGAHTKNGNGLLRFHYDVEMILKQLPANISITTLRPVGFYYNLFGFIPTIKSQGKIITNYNAKYKEPWVSPSDIADVAAEEMLANFSGRKIRYVASDALSSDEIAATLGKAIGKPDLKWIVIPDEQLLNNMLALGMNPEIAKGFIVMNTARQTGTLYEDYDRNYPATLGKVKLTEFANEFAEAYQQ